MPLIRSRPVAVANLNHRSDHPDYSPRPSDNPRRDIPVAGLNHSPCRVSWYYLSVVTGVQQCSRNAQDVVQSAAR